MLLCTPALSKFDRSQCEHAAAPYVILEFVRRIGYEACSLFQCIFHEADEFANLKPRNKATFVRDKRSFAFDLGLVHCSVQSLVLAKSNWTDSVRNAFCSGSNTDHFIVLHAWKSLRSNANSVGEARVVSHGLQ